MYKNFHIRHPFKFICEDCKETYVIHMPSRKEAEEQRWVFRNHCIKCYKKLLKNELLETNMHNDILKLTTKMGHKCLTKT